MVREDITVDSVRAQISAGRHMVPDHLWRGIENHILYGGDTGNFLTKMFENDLVGAVCGADEETLARLYDLAKFLYNYVPHNCWRNEANVFQWRQRGGIQGGAHIAVKVPV